MDNPFLDMLNMAADVRQAARLAMFTEQESFQLALEFVRSTFQHQLAQASK